MDDFMNYINISLENFGKLEDFGGGGDSSYVLYIFKGT